MSTEFNSPETSSESATPPESGATQPSGPSEELTQRKWQPLSREQRRILGVLLEKAKTTPDQYPISLNGLTTGCNQKSNRSPQMNLDSEDVQVILDELRELGTVVEVQSGGRVAKFKHLMYDWLGVDKAEIAVIAELMLRGEQTLGELRGRAARMEKIADLNALRPIVKRLVDRELVVELTPEGRGQLVTHGLYQPQELERIRAEAPVADSSARPRRPAAAGASNDQVETLQAEVAALKEQFAAIEERLAQLEKMVQ